MGSAAKIVLGNAFPGDENEVLRCIQENDYDDLCWRVVDCCVRAYSVAERVLGVHTEIGERIRADVFMPRDLIDGIYSAIAARMRQSFPELMQPDLFDTPEQHLQQMEVQWRSYLLDEATALAEEPLFVRALATLAFDGNSEEGRAARKIVEGVIAMRYRSLLSTGSFLSLEEWVKRDEL
jgi:hypothetical protein